MLGVTLMVIIGALWVTGRYFRSFEVVNFAVEHWAHSDWRNGPFSLVPRPEARRVKPQFVERPQVSDESVAIEPLIASPNFVPFRTRQRWPEILNDKSIVCIGVGRHVYSDDPRNNWGKVFGISQRINGRGFGDNFNAVQESWQRSGVVDLVSNSWSGIVKSDLEVRDQHPWTRRGIEGEFGGFSVLTGRIRALFSEADRFQIRAQQAAGNDDIGDRENEQGPFRRILGIPPMLIGLVLNYSGYPLCLIGWRYLLNDDRNRRTWLRGGALLVASALCLGLGGSIALAGIWW